MPLSVQATHVVLVTISDASKPDCVDTFCFYTGSSDAADSLTRMLKKVGVFEKHWPWWQLATGISSHYRIEHVEWAPL